MNSKNGMFKDQVDLNLRLEGKFWTPRKWAREAQLFLDNVYGSQWYKKWLVWDPCCGGGNLTKGRRFPNLIQSTLVQEDFEHCDNDGALQLTYDFLNNLVVPASVDAKLRQAKADGVPLVFFMNPPYATPGKTAVRWDSTKAGLTSTIVQSQMAGVYGSHQLYLQFLYRAISIAKEYDLEFIIGMFSASTYLLRRSMQSYHDWLFSRAQFIDGFVFPANEFENIKTKWAISFAVFENGWQHDDSEFEFKVKEYKEGRIQTYGSRKFYKVPEDQSAEAWVKGNGLPRTQLAPAQTTGVRFKEDKLFLTHRDALGFYAYNGFFLQERDNTYIVSSVSGSGRGVPINPDGGVWSVIATFAVIRLFTLDWLNEKDEFFLPRKAYTYEYEAWLLNALVFLMMNKQNNATGAVVDHAGDRWRLHNHFFWHSRNYCVARWPGVVAGFNDLDEQGTRYANRAYYEANNDLLPWACVQLMDKEPMLWPESIDLMETVDKYIDKIHEARVIPNSSFQSERWDAGWFQLRSMLYGYGRDAIFHKRRVLQNKLAEGVRQFGFFGKYEDQVLNQFGV